MTAVARFSPVTHRRGRLIDTYGRRLLVLHVSNDDQEREQGSEDNQNVNAHCGNLWARSQAEPPITPISRSCSSRPPPIRPCEGSAMATKTRTHFTFRIDTWTPDGENIVEHVAGVEDYQVALATFLAACQRWPGTPITLRQGARVIEDSR